MLHNLSCLENIVGYKTPCETVTSKSGYYINDLHGITFRSMESVADEEYKNGKTIFTKKYNIHANYTKLIRKTNFTISDIKNSVVQRLEKDGIKIPNQVS